MALGHKILSWIDRRWPLSPLVHLSIDEQIPGGSSYLYSEGSAVLILFLLQALTGVIQLFFYVPTIDHAYNSVSYLRTEVPFGWLVHGIHYWGANLMIIVLVLHIARVYIWGAYKHPRELTWLAGVFLLLTTLGFSFTGAPLPWDQVGYWAGEVGTSIASTIPFAGNFMKQLIRGGEEMGQLALSRFFAIHVMILPAVLGGLFFIHIVAFRKFGSVGPWDPRKAAQRGPFWPDQLFKDTVVATLLVLLLVALNAFAPQPFSGAVDLLDTSYIPKPEWNFLFLYQALKYFQGPLEPVGTAGIPTVLILILILVPFIDRNSERNPLRRPVAITLGVIFAGAIIAFSIIGYLSPGSSETPSPQVLAKEQAPASPEAHKESVAKGQQLFATQGCMTCHRIGGGGGTAGPDLSTEGERGRTRQWLIEQIKDPKSHNPNTIMPSFSYLSDQQIGNLVDYLLSLVGAPGQKQKEKKAAPGQQTQTPPPSGSQASQGQPGKAAFMIGNFMRGEASFEQNCVSCHGPEGKGNPSGGGAPRLNPISPRLFNKDPRIFAENVDTFIQHGSPGSGGLAMPAFGDQNILTQQGIANVEAYILKLNGVDRGELLHPGMRPLHFFYLVLGVLVAVLLIQGGIRVKRNIT